MRRNAPGQTVGHTGSPVRPGAVRADRGRPRLPRRGPRSDEHRQHDNLPRDHRLRPVHQTRPPDLRWKAARHPTGAHEETSAGITSCRGGRARPVNCDTASPGSPRDHRDGSTDVEELNRSSTHVVLTPTTPPAATRLRTVTERRPHPAHGERHQLRQFQIGSTRRADSPTVTWQPTVRCHRAARSTTRTRCPVDFLGHFPSDPAPEPQSRLTSPFTGSGSRLRIPGACRCAADRYQGSAADVRVTSVAGRPMDTPAFG